MQDATEKFDQQVSKCSLISNHLVIKSKKILIALNTIHNDIQLVKSRHEETLKYKKIFTKKKGKGIEIEIRNL